MIVTMQTGLQRNPGQTVGAAFSALDTNLLYGSKIILKKILHSPD